MTIDKFIKVAIFFAVTAVALGALGAHALKEILTENKLHSFETGVRYQFFHALAILFLALNTEKFNPKLNRSLYLMTTGICCFSFSLIYVTQVPSNEPSATTTLTPNFKTYKRVQYNPDNV